MILIKVIYCIPPGRFPTVVHDPGLWVQQSSEELQIDMLSLNYYFWRKLFDSTLNSRLKNGIPTVAKIRFFMKNLLESRKKPDALQSLLSFENIETYRSQSTYLSCISSILSRLDYINSVQRHCTFDLFNGIQVRDIDYSDTKSLVEYSLKKTVLSDIIGEVIDECDTSVDLVLFQICSHQELLSACIAARIIKDKNRAVHICLADHGYENFTLTPYLEKHPDTILLDVFDTIIEKKQEKDILIQGLINAIKSNKNSKGILKKKTYQAQDTVVKTNIPLPLIPSFSARPIFWMRINPTGCYWGKCAFCTQNTKHTLSELPETDIDSLLDRIHSLIDSGYKDFIFSDEALTYNFLNRFSDQIISRGLKFNWCCRSRLEMDLSRDLFRKVKQAGCIEILYGLESVSPGVLKKMNKYDIFPGKENLDRIFDEMELEGISAHINLIIGFPGENPEDAVESTEYTIKAIRRMKQSTYTLNKFSLYYGSKIFFEPGKYGITIIEPKGDNPCTYSFIYNEGAYSYKDTLDSVYMTAFNKLFEGTDWSRVGYGNQAYSAWFMYSMTGHGAVFKSESDNIFATKYLIENKNYVGKGKK